MSSLRRDLFERRLWPLAVVLIAAIVAVPFLLGGHGGHATASLAANAGPVPAAATTTASTSTTGSPSVAGGHDTGSRRSGGGDPFAASGAGTTSTASSSADTKAAASTSAGTTSAGTTATTTTAPSSATPGTSGSPTGDSAGATDSSATTSTTTTHATTTGSTGTTTTTAVVTETHRGPASHETWTVYGVDIRLTRGSAGSAAVASDLPRYTLLPAATSPRVMYVGATTHGARAVFVVGAGVSVDGRAICHPSHAHCALIALAAGRSETLRWTVDNGQRRSARLTVTRIAAQVFHQRSKAEAAIDRHSQSGLCTLQLADPVDYRYTSTGQLQAVSNSSPACTRQMRRHLTAFTGSDPGADVAGPVTFAAPDATSQTGDRG